MAYYTYFMASQRNGTLYIGVTNDLIRRVHEHKQGFVAGFTRQHNIKTLVHFEVFEDIINAIAREKQLKAWKRAWKTELIELANPYWNDLYPDIV
ncbi:GIY-YIG nuclease family protein [Undibacterium arcticum]|uniref:GIY-YIG nuclease family protein n=1 Tax=Undibacterium arcticum TaxID=1762892 RepID=A0ABV7F4X2_9BURK